MIFKSRQTAGLGFAVLWCGFLGSTAAQSIYTCVDDKGRKLTSDRPIAECMDRAQKELNPSGTVRRVLAPPPPPKSRAEMEADEKVQAEARMQQAEENRRDRALKIRYPDRASHNKARVAALEQVNETIKTATKRTQELADQRASIGAELDFYKNSPGKLPPALKRRVDQTDANIAEQKRLMADKEAEKISITQRFDAEMVKLQPRWGVADTSTATGPANSVKKP